MSRMNGDDPALVMRLYEHDQDEWWDVCRLINPALSREAFDQQWQEFMAWLGVNPRTLH